MKKTFLLGIIFLAVTSAYAAPLKPSIEFGLDSIVLPCLDLGPEVGLFADVVAKVCTKVPAPTDSPCGAGGSCSYGGTQSVSLSDAYTGSTLYGCYTLDGSVPWYNGATCGNGAHYTGAFNIAATSTLKYIFSATNYSSSPLETTTYTINLNPAAFVQDAYNSSACAGGPATCAADSITTTTNNVLYVQVVYHNAATLTSVTDTCGTSGGASNTYVADGTKTTGTAYNSATFHVIVGFGKACVVTAHFSPTSANAAVYVAESSGENLTTPVGQFVINSQDTPGTGANAITSTNITITQTNTLIIGSTISCWGNADSYSAGTGYTLTRNVASGNCNIGAEWKTFASTGTVAATFTTTGGTNLGDLTAATSVQHP